MNKDNSFIKILVILFEKCVCSNAIKMNNNIEQVEIIQNECVGFTEIKDALIIPQNSIPNANNKYNPFNFSL